MYGCKFVHLSHECVTVYKTTLMLYSQSAGLKNVLKAFKNIYLYKVIFRMMEIVYIMVKMTV